MKKKEKDDNPELTAIEEQLKKWAKEDTQRTFVLIASYPSDDDEENVNSKMSLSHAGSEEDIALSVWQAMTFNSKFHYIMCNLWELVKKKLNIPDMDATVEFSDAKQ